jgi:hypothetical protein
MKTDIEEYELMMKFIESEYPQVYQEAESHILHKMGV